MGKRAKVLASGSEVWEEDVSDIPNILFSATFDHNFRPPSFV